MLSNRFFERVINSVFVDTRKYRYVARESRDGSVVIVRLPLVYLNTPKSLTHWEFVKELY